MKFFIAVTDNDWFALLSRLQPDEVNFWNPGGVVFKALLPGQPFLFKLHAPLNAIVGGGYFVRWVQLAESTKNFSSLALVSPMRFKPINNYLAQQVIKNQSREAYYIHYVCTKTLFNR